MQIFTATILAVVVGLFPAIVAGVENPDLRYLKAYSGYSYEGPFEYFLDYVPDLSVYGIDNAIKSICYTGSWLLYSEANYEGNNLAYSSGVDYCRNLSSTYMNQASSLRYAGSPDSINDVYYTLYEADYFVGAEFKSNTNAESVGLLDLNVSSIYINGQSPWTFFTGLDYTGLAICVYPKYTTSGENSIQIDYYYIRYMSLLGLEDNSIRSVAKGCLSKKIVRLPPSEASLRPEGDHKLVDSVH